MLSIYLITLLVNITAEEWSKSVWGEPPVRLEAKIVNPKLIYYTKEPIWIHYKFYNVSNEPVKTWSPEVDLGWSSGILRLEGVNEKGKKVVPRLCVWSDLAVRNWEKEGGKLLLPGDTVEGTMNIGYWFSADLSREGKIYLKNLVYTNMIGVIHIEPRPLYKPFWWGTVKAPINFEVNIVPPQGKEKEVLDLLFPVTGKETISDYLKIIHKYSTSVYIPIIFDEMIELRLSKSFRNKEYSEYNKLLEAIEWYIKNFKDSPKYKFPPKYWEKWMENRDKLIIGIKEYKEKKK